jgi:hypothetical protein
LSEVDAGAAQAVATTIRGWLDAQAARQAEQERRTQLYERFANAGPVTTFRVLGVQVLASEGTVYTIGSHDPVAKTNYSRLLGPLIGAQAMVTDGSQA